MIVNSIVGSDDFLKYIPLGFFIWGCMKLEKEQWEQEQWNLRWILDTKEMADTAKWRKREKNYETGTWTKKK